MKYLHLYTLLLLAVFHTSCGQQNQTNESKDNIWPKLKDTVSSYGPNTMVRNVKKGRNGTILMAASFGGVLKAQPGSHNT